MSLRVQWRWLSVVVGVLLVCGVVAAAAFDEEDGSSLAAETGVDGLGATTTAAPTDGAASTPSSLPAPGDAGSSGSPTTVPSKSTNAPATTIASSAASGATCPSATSTIDRAGLWFAKPGARAAFLVGGAVEAMAWSPDGRRVAWLSGDGSVLRVAAGDASPPATLVDGWDVLPVVGWSDLSDAVIVAGLGIDDAMGVWRVPLDGSVPRLVYATESPPVAFAVGGWGPWGEQDGRSRWVGAVVAGGSVDVVRGDGTAGRTLVSGAARDFDSVAVDRLGENVAVGGPGGMWMALGRAGEARRVVSDGRVRVLEWGWSSEWVATDVGSPAALSVVRAGGDGDDGGVRRLAEPGDSGWALSNVGRAVFVGVPGVGVVEKSLVEDDAQERLLHPRATLPAVSLPGAVAFLVGGVVCVAPDSASLDRSTVAGFAGGASLSTTVPMEWSSTGMLALVAVAS